MLCTYLTLMRLLKMSLQAVKLGESLAASGAVSHGPQAHLFLVILGRPGSRARGCVERGGR